MSTSREASILRRLGERLLTLRVTVVLAEDLDSAPHALEHHNPRDAVYATWSRALCDRAGTAPPGAHGDFGALAVEARRLRQSVELESTSDFDPHEQAVLHRIETYARVLADGDRGQLGTSGGPVADEDPGVRQMMDHLLSGKAQAIGTNPVLLETVVHLDGDVTTRVNPTWLFGDGVGGARHAETLIALQRLGLDVSLHWWAGLVDLVRGAAGTLVGWIGRSGA